MPIKHDGVKKVSAQFEGNPTYKGKLKIIILLIIDGKNMFS